MFFISTLSPHFLVGPNISPRKKTMSKALGAKVSGNGKQNEGKPKVIESTYDDMSRLLEKYGETLKWGEVYHMLKKSNFSI
jgi:hypothetical protein